MNVPNLLLGDQIENSIRLCTQSIGSLFGFRGSRIDNKTIHQRDLQELNFLIPPFLYYLNKSGIAFSPQVLESLVDALVLFRSANGSYNNSKFILKNQHGDVLDTALSTLNLLKISQISKQSFEIEINDATQWLNSKLSLIGKNKNEINVDTLIAAYCILQVAGNNDDRTLIKSTVSSLSPLKFLTEIKNVISYNKQLESEYLYPFAVRMLIEIALLSGHQQFFDLAHKTLETQISQYRDLINFLNNGKSSIFSSKKIHLGKCSLWAYDCLQLYDYFKFPELLELSFNFLRIISDVIIMAHNNKQPIIPDYFNLKTGEYSNSTSITSIRFFLDAAELSKKYLSNSMNYQESLEQPPAQKLITLKGVRQEA